MQFEIIDCPSWQTPLLPEEKEPPREDIRVPDWIVDRGVIEMMPIRKDRALVGFYGTAE